MKPWVKRAVIGAAIVAPLLFVVTVEHTRGRHGLNQLLAAMSARGEDLDISHFDPATPSAEQNGFTDLANPPGDFRVKLGRTAECPPLLKFITPGRVATARQIQLWNSDIKTTRTWDQTAALLGDSADLLDFIRTAVRKPAYRSTFDYRNWSALTPVPWLAEIKKTALFLAMATLYDLHREKNAAASERLLDLLRLVDAQKSERLIIGQLVRNACANIAFSVTWQALQTPGWTDAQLAAWQSAWSNFDPARDFVATLEMDRAVTYDLFQRVRGSPAKLAAALEEREQAEEQSGGGLVTSLPTHGLLLNDIHAPFWRIAWADQDEANALERINRAIDRARTAFTNSWLAAADPSADADADNAAQTIKEGTENWSGYDRMRYLFSAWSFVANDKTIARATCGLTEQRMVITALAIARFRLKRGAPPADLSALVPEFLPEVPRDGMDGKPLRYHPLPNNQFILYSVGLDGKDDGGNPALRPGKERFTGIWDGKDALWPAAATDAEEEAAEVEKKKSGR